MTGESNRLPDILRGFQVCMRSAHITSTSSGAFRTIANYRLVQLMGHHITMTTRQSTAELMAVHPSTGVMKVVIKLDKKVPRKTAARSSDGTVQETFAVVEVEDTCLLLSSGEGGTT